MENNFIYLDNASTTPLSENVLNIINSTYKNYWHNPSSTYELGIKCSTYLEKIRSKIAYIFEAEPEDIIFTSGSSESTNIVFNNIYENFKNGRVVISNVEHQATNICANKLRKQNWDIYEWTVNNDGILNISTIDKILTNETKLVSIIWGQSEIGTIQPVQFIGSKCEELNLKKLLLEVSQSNLNAERFYERFEFSTVGIRKNYYKDGSHALLKEKKLTTK